MAILPPFDGEGNIEINTFLSEECEPFQDGNGIYDEGEPYIEGVVGEHDFNDRNGNGICDFTGNVLIDDGGEININTFSSQ